MSPRLFLVGRVWHFRVTYRGRRIQRSTKQTGRRAAEAIAALAYDDLKRKTDGLAKIPTVKQLAHAWLDAHGNTVSAAHLKNVEIFARLHLGALSNVRVDQLTSADVELARDRFLANHAPGTANAWSRNLKLIVRWGHRHDMVGQVGWSIRPLKAQQRIKPVLYANEIGAWLNAIDEARNPAVSLACRLMIYCGLRESEAISADWRGVDLKSRTYSAPKTKGKECVPLPVPSSLMEILRRLHRPAGLMCCRADGLPFTPGFATRYLWRANARVGTPGITCHSLRRSYATGLHERGLRVAQIQRLLRHKSPTVTEKYLHAREQNPLDVLERYDEDILQGKSGEVIGASQ